MKKEGVGRRGGGEMEKGEGRVGQKETSEKIRQLMQMVDSMKRGSEGAQQPPFKGLGGMAFHLTDRSALLNAMLAPCTSIKKHHTVGK